MKFGKEKSSGSYRAQRPVGLRKSGIPDSVETPAPVNATIRPSGQELGRPVEPAVHLRGALHPARSVAERSGQPGKDSLPACPASRGRDAAGFDLSARVAERLQAAPAVGLDRARPAARAAPRRSRAGGPGAATRAESTCTSTPGWRRRAELDVARDLPRQRQLDRALHHRLGGRLPGRLARVGGDHEQPVKRMGGEEIQDGGPLDHAPVDEKAVPRGDRREQSRHRGAGDQGVERRASRCRNARAVPETRSVATTRTAIGAARTPLEVHVTRQGGAKRRGIEQAARCPRAAAGRTSRAGAIRGRPAPGRRRRPPAGSSARARPAARPRPRRGAPR